MTSNGDRLITHGHTGRCVGTHTSAPTGPGARHFVTRRLSVCHHLVMFFRDAILPVMLSLFSTVYYIEITLIS